MTSKEIQRIVDEYEVSIEHYEKERANKKIFKCPCGREHFYNENLQYWAGKRTAYKYALQIIEESHDKKNVGRSRT